MNITIEGSKDKLYYLASPYSHNDSFVRQLRYEAIIYTASKLTKEGFRLVEPIGMCHQQSIQHGMPAGYEFWKTRDRGFIDVCDGLIVLTLRGWKESEGVTDEIQYAKSQDKPIYYLRPEDVFPYSALYGLMGD